MAAISGRLTNVHVRGRKACSAPTLAPLHTVAFRPTQFPVATILPQLSPLRGSVSAHAEAAPAVATTTTETTTVTEKPGLHELCPETFYPYLEEHKETLVVVDFYTDWCGPCKIIYPELVQLAADMPHIRVVKFNCNKTNKDMGKQLGIRVAPTFHLYKNNVKVADMTGAKVAKLKELIGEALGQ